MARLRIEVPLDGDHPLGGALAQDMVKKVETLQNMGVKSNLAFKVHSKRVHRDPANWLDRKVELVCSTTSGATILGIKIQKSPKASILGLMRGPREVALVEDPGGAGAADLCLPGRGVPTLLDYLLGLEWGGTDRKL